MYNVIKSRLKQGYRTSGFPDVEPEMPDRFTGLPEIDQTACRKDCERCIGACPVNAIARDAETNKLTVDLGKCIFCGKCVAECGEQKAIRFNDEYALSALKREDLVIGKNEFKMAEQKDFRFQSLFGRSLRIRQVSAGGCAACELDVNVLTTLAWDMGRFGIDIVASPRHADCILVTGPVSKNMLLAMKKTFDSIPQPRFVIACGACAISGGLYADNAETCGGVEKIFKADLYIPGCPPHPATILDGMLRLMGKI